MGRTSKNSAGLSRRRFIRNSAAAAAAITIVPSSVLAKPGPNDKVNLACIGNANRGGVVTKMVGGKGDVNVVALCDVARNRAENMKKKWGNAKNAAVFQDFRKMFDKMHKDIDAITNGTPDHAHFPISMLAMSLGKGVYVEKPMARTFRECELMMKAAKKYKVATQMGNQGHSSGQYHQFKAWVEKGVIKDVRHVDAAMNSGRRWHGWGASCKGYPKGGTTPGDIDWDVWCGTAPYNDYSNRLDGGNWRCWFDYGNGAFGDWGPHILDTIHEFLELGLPYEINALKLGGRNKWVFPQESSIQFKFKERGPGMPEMDIIWYDGKKNHPPRPKQLGEKRRLTNPGKVIFSDTLAFMGGSHSSQLRVIPDEKHKELSKAGKLPKAPGGSDIATNFIRGVKGEEVCRSRFEVSGLLTQVFMLGCIAQNVGGSLTFDDTTKRITNNPEADKLIEGNPPRKGWEEFYGM
jgi:predicted dehydrogenase